MSRRLGGDLVPKGMEKAEVLNAFFTLVVTGMTFLQEPSAPRTSGKIWSDKNLPSVEKDRVMEHLNKLDRQIHGPDRMHP